MGGASLVPTPLSPYKGRERPPPPLFLWSGGGGGKGLAGRMSAALCSLCWGTLGLVGSRLDIRGALCRDAACLFEAGAGGEARSVGRHVQGAGAAGRQQP